MIDVRNAAGAAGIFALGLFVRAATWPRVFGESGIMPPHGADEFYHLRRIWYSFRHFPDTLSHDPYVNYPVGGEIVLAPGFDLAVAGLAKVLLRTSDQAAVEAVAAWVPAVLGALAAVATAAIAARVFSATAGVIAGVLLAVLPGHYHYSQVGYVDHHVAVSLELALLVTVALVVARRPAGRSWISLALLLGMGSAAFLLTWPGALLHVALLQGLAIVWMIGARSAEIAGARAWHLALAQGSAALALAPQTLDRGWSQFGSFSPLVLSSFQPLWFATTAISCALLAGLWTRTRKGRQRGQRWLGAAGVGLVALAMALVAVPDLASSLRVAAGWFVEGEENFLSGISEIKPLFDPAARSGNLDAETHLTRLIYVYPLALVWLIVRAVRSRRSDLWLVAGIAAVHYGLVLTQIRFLNSFAISYVIVWGGALAALLQFARPRTEARPWPIRAGVLALAVVLALFALQPSARFMGPLLSIAWEGPDGAPPTRRFVRTQAYHSAATWLRDHSPTTEGYLDPTRQPQYGVLAIWDMGHLIRYVAERPLVMDNFGVYAGREQFLAGLRYFGADREDEALRVAGQLGVRYVLVDRRGSGLGRDQGPDSMTGRLYQPRGGRGAGDGQSQRVLPPLQRHRLIMETSLARPPFPHVMIYEIVAGARIEGSAAPGEVVQLRLPIRSNMRAAPFSYRTRSVADDDGRYRFAVPYPTGAAAPIRTGARYLLRCGGESAAVVVSEASVADGATIAGPTFSCSPPATKTPGP